MAENTEQLQILTDNIKTNSRRYCLDMSITKTKTMVIHRHNNTKAKITKKKRKLKQVEEFKYLGQTITADAKTEKEPRIHSEIA